MSYYAYLRVSTEEQNTDRQEIAVLKYAQENGFVYANIYQDKVSGKNFKRPSYQEMKETVKKDDVIIIKDISRLGRNWDENTIEWKWFLDNGIRLVVLDTPILSTNDGIMTIDMKLVKEQIFTLMCYLSQKERELISQRTKEGLAATRAKGQRLGRPDVYDEKLLSKAINEYEHRSKGETLATISAKYGFSAPTLYNRIQRKKKGEME